MLIFFVQEMNKMVHYENVTEKIRLPPWYSYFKNTLLLSLFLLFLFLLIFRSIYILSKSPATFHNSWLTNKRLFHQIYTSLLQTTSQTIFFTGGALPRYWCVKTLRTHPATLTLLNGYVMDNTNTPSATKRKQLRTACSNNNDNNK